MVDRNSGFCLIVALCAWLTWFILLPNNLAWAQEKVNPSKPITFIINFPPGSSADLPLRVVHAALQNALEFFKQVFGLDIVPVHFTGTGPVKNAIMGGHVHPASTGLGAFVPLIKSKEVTLLVTGAPKRLQDFPDVPTLKDKGFPKAALNIWSGVFAHAKTPKNVVDKFEYEPAPLILALVLGRMAEESLRQSLVLSRGDLAVFIQSPISCGALIIAFLVMSSSLWIAGLKRLGRFIPLPSMK